MRRKLVALAIVVAAAGVAAAPATMSFHASPELRVIQTSTSSTGTLALVNDTAQSIHVESITRDPSCDGAVLLGLNGAFDVAAGVSTLVAISCLAMPGSAGMRRCVFHVNGTSGPSLLDFEGVCDYSTGETLVPQTTSINFGNVPVGGGASVVVNALNTSSTPVTRLAFQTTDLAGNFEIGSPCTTNARECEGPISSVGMGSNAAFTVSCRPKAAGAQSADLFVTTNTGQRLSSPIALSCFGIATTNPVFSLTGAPANAGSVPVAGGTATSSIRIRNGGGGTLTIKNVQIVNGAALDWSYQATGACTGQIPSFCNLAADQEVTLGVTFDPSDLDVRNSTLLIEYFDTADRSTTVQLLGRGLGARIELVGAATAIDFGRVPVGMASPVTFKLINRGNVPVSDVELASMPTGAPFALGPASPLTLAPNVETTVTATCQPTAVGTFATTFHVSSPAAFMSPPITLDATCEGTSMPLYANPTTIALGEIRTGTTPPPTVINVLGTSPITISSIALETPSPNLALIAAPGPTPLAVMLRVTAVMDGSLANAILVTASNGDMIRIPIAGQVVTAAYEAPALVSLGTFCLNQPTTSSRIALSSVGTASIRLSAPVMALAPSSPFDISPATPSSYPATLLAEHDAVVEVTPKRQASPSVQLDDLIWTTDVAGMPTARTTLSATFINDGGAIAPSALGFGQVPIHNGTSNAQTITLQNCDPTPITLTTPLMPAAFAIDSGTFPMQLEPNERTTIAVGFRPVRLGIHSGTMQIPSDQLTMPLEVMLTGEGVNTSGEGDGGPDPDGIDERSFYACSCSGPGMPSQGWPIAGAVLVVVGPWRRRRRRA
jgi:MYXO-CTERM domain-containing protein